MANAYRDENNVPTLIASSSTDGKTPVRVYADPTTHRLKVDFGSTPATATTWATAGNTSTVTDAAVTATSIILLMPATPPAGLWAVICGAGSFVITSSDSESAALAFTYKVFA